MPGDVSGGEVCPARLGAPGGAGRSRPRASLACIVLAHTDPVHVRRLVAALDPFPVFLHCDRRTDPGTFAQMTDGLPARCTVMRRIATGWARWENVEAELAGYALALRTPATHVAVLTGSDYPLMSTPAMSELLERYRTTSLLTVNPLPYVHWGRSGGMARLRYLHWAYRKHMIRLPVPRRIPAGIRPAGGSQLKVLARGHAEAVLATVRGRPDLPRFWRRTWIADETFVPSVLNTPQFVPGWAEQHVPGYAWWIGWDGSRRKSPPLVGMDRFPVLRDVDQLDLPFPPMFARKFATWYDTDVLDAIDCELRAVPRAARPASSPLS